MENKRVLILGLDGATWDVLRPLMAEGRMPRLKSAVEAGTHGILFSTVPPITPAAWTTFLTGRQPGAHGILDFERYEPFANRLRFNNTLTVEHVRNLWRILSDHGLRVGSVNVPMTFPAFPVNGFLISGFETPGVESDFVYPAELRNDILSRWPDPTLDENWRRRLLSSRRAFDENLRYITASFHQGYEMTRYCADRFGWDCLMVVLKLVDNLQHKTWRYIDPRWRDRDPWRSSRVVEAFAELDSAVGRFLDYARESSAVTLIVSDHGHGSLEGKIQANLLLHRWGYLALRPGAKGLAKMQHVLKRFRGPTQSPSREGEVLHDLPVDFSRTRACVMHAGMAGFLYINLQGRQPCGIVPPNQYEKLRSELQERLSGPECRIRSPGGEAVSLFTRVDRPEDLYGCRREDRPWLPDLILTPHRPLAVVRRIRGRNPVRWLRYRKIEGTHRPEGIFVAVGPGIAAGRRVNPGLADCAPTVLTLLGLPVPDDMEGTVIADVFENPPSVRHERAAAVSRRSEDDAIYSDAELEKVTSRLSDLGYLE